MRKRRAIVIVPLSYAAMLTARALDEMMIDELHSNGVLQLAPGES